MPLYPACVLLRLTVVVDADKQEAVSILAIASRLEPSVSDIDICTHKNSNMPVLWSHR